MSTYAISDIHGCNKTFRLALKTIKLKKTDTLILLGDFIDRGPDSKGVLDTIMLLIENKFHVVCLKGNHEFMFLESLNDFSAKINWIKNGGDKTMLSFHTRRLESIPNKYIEFIKSFKLYHIENKYIFVHAGLNLNNENPYEDEVSMVWMRDVNKFMHNEWLNDKYIIHGHNPTQKNELLDQLELDYKIICIDNGCFLTKENYGNICVFDLTNFKMIFIQNNENNK